MHAQTCPWANTSPLMQEYHDHEWGRPVHDDRLLFEFLILEGMQAGLSWEIILKRREGMRAALDGFDPHAIADYSSDKIQSLMENPDIIRNRRKLNALVQNARAFLDVQRKHGSFDTFVWSFVDFTPVLNTWTRDNPPPAQTPASQALSRALKALGFAFVGPTICYAFMQAVGMVNDHIVGCPARKV